MASLAVAGHQAGLGLALAGGPAGALSGGGGGFLCSWAAAAAVGGGAVLLALVLLRRHCAGGRGRGVPESPKRGRSSIMQAPAHACAAGHRRQSQAQPAKQPQEKKVEEAQVPQVAASWVCPSPAGGGGRPEGPTLLRYRGPTQPHRGVSAGAAGSPRSEGAGDADDFGLELHAPAAPAYRHGAAVECFSAAERRWLQGTLAVICLDGSSVHYEVAVGKLVKQVRRDVALEALREPLEEGEAVEVLVAPTGHPGEPQRWLPATMAAPSRPSAGYRVSMPRRLLEQGGAAAAAGDGDGEEEVLERVRPERLRRRFPGGSAVEVYRGPASGWVAGAVERTQEAAAAAAAAFSEASATTGSVGVDVPVRLELGGRPHCADAEAHQRPRTGHELVPAHLVRMRPHRQG